jgi:hypothetical protein
MHEKLTMEFNELKLIYLKEEHVMKMQICYVELVPREEERNMKQHQYQCQGTSGSTGSSSSSMQ